MGFSVGSLVGSIVGWGVGSLVGARVGPLVGTSSCKGESDGTAGDAITTFIFPVIAAKSSSRSIEYFPRLVIFPAENVLSPRQSKPKSSDNPRKLF